MSETTAYLAGLFDGEGSVMVSARASDGPLYYHLRVSVTSTHNGIMYFLSSYYNGCINNGRPHKGKPIWFWTLHSGNAAEFLRDIKPYLIIKKTEAEIAIEFQEHMYSYKSQILGRRRKLPEEIKEYRESFRLRIHAARQAYANSYLSPE